MLYRYSFGSRNFGNPQVLKTLKIIKEKQKRNFQEFTDLIYSQDSHYILLVRYI